MLSVERVKTVGKTTFNLIGQSVVKIEPAIHVIYGHLPYPGV